MLNFGTHPHISMRKVFKILKEEQVKVKRMRTIKECVKMLKAEDPNSAITYHTIKTLCLTNQVNYIKIGTRYLVNYDSLLDNL